jgi:hypothetical protein
VLEDSEMYFLRMSPRKVFDRRPKMPKGSSSLEPDHSQAVSYTLISET